MLPVDVKAFGTGAHAHYIAKTMHLKATLPNGQEKKLLWINDWDFAWQDQYQFKDFVAAMAFVRAVADLAEKRQHHPDILIRWNKVTLSLSTHDAGGISQKDFDLAAQTVTTPSGSKPGFSRCRASKLRTSSLNYGLLSELNTKPRTTYLGRVRNPNPALVSKQG